MNLRTMGQHQLIENIEKEIIIQKIGNNSVLINRSYENIVDFINDCFSTHPLL